MIEVETKYALADPAGFAARLAGWAELSPRRDEDQYFNAPDRDFARTDEAFRIRSIGNTNVVTYKGPKFDTQTKSRFELELPIGDGPEEAARWRAMFVRLGYRPTGIVRKHRRIFTTSRDGFEIQATIDTVDGVGTYAELEIVTDDSRYPAARDLILTLAGELGLTQLERRSYISLLLQKSASTREPKQLDDVAALRKFVAGCRRDRKKIGFVPTMGALHAGHAALIERAKAQCDCVIVSIFVNPTQFGPNEDYTRYPRTLEADRELCRSLGVDGIFVPAADEVYPPGFVTYVDPGPIATVFEGAIRPGHFRGVATVVLKLFQMVQPDATYFGQKDAQQVAVVGRLIRDCNLPIEFVVVPTIREQDGLALSSRNRYLDPTQRSNATVLYRALSAARADWKAGERDPARLRATMAREAVVPGVQLDYAEVVDPDSFAAPSSGGRALAVIAARFGTTRLIDNLELTTE
ncbi:MAG: pantoate--beta-alanine ligase [Gemmataceae bacterium]|nr:pantoate--beta-alanine ligase [Gemmataceae bacterium]